MTKKTYLLVITLTRVVMEKKCPNHQQPNECSLIETQLEERTLKPKLQGKYTLKEKRLHYFKDKGSLPISLGDSFITRLFLKEFLN